MVGGSAECFRLPQFPRMELSFQVIDHRANDVASSPPAAWIYINMPKA